MGLGESDGFSKFPGHHAPAFDSLPTHPMALDDSALDGLVSKTHLAQDALTALGSTMVSPQVNLAQLDALIAKLTQARALAASIGGTVAGAGARAGVGVSYPQTAPTGRMGGPR